MEIHYFGVPAEKPTNLWYADFLPAWLRNHLCHRIFEASYCKYPKQWFKSNDLGILNWLYTRMKGTKHALWFKYLHSVSHAIRRKRDHWMKHLSKLPSWFWEEFKHPEVIKLELEELGMELGEEEAARLLSKMPPPPPTATAQSETHEEEEEEKKMRLKLVKHNYYTWWGIPQYWSPM
eukprot:TRINITY_DN14055_c0_g1_i1.p1 TRINITY_DN14055_c0_g1~~TRINITY_DN14055_c0_g1_i1.p1  ORF type:complete len:178 (+),score=27.91 TRINITY_DN14055_c0_g1_i1:361-894(+)